MSSTPLQKALGHVYGPGATAKTEGAIPCWLEVNGSRIMGGLIDLQYKVDGTHKVVDFYPSAIRTATPCVDLGNHNYCPIPTYRVLNDVTAEGTTVEIAKQDGLPLLVTGMSLANAADPGKKVTIAANKVTVDAEGFYKLTITANDLGALKKGDVLILEAFANKTPLGLTYENLLFEGVDVTKSKLNVKLIDNGRLIADTAAPAPAAMRQALQTVKWEDVFNG